ncbi:glycosyltransferase family 4 protein [Thermococcus sp. Bubb.Bath]|uniref:glycosyltransferase family 4 protein n=1 Tax=Thermococcus sp. Bubb.Bath TaxID=1638242 RepID=UPI0014389A40|nr:glycosyltransferase family 4 protein [Thermococcus sp. Bubb.Bath]NJF25187.1 glycosyltransferase [Thermococcus sp. Bubb.Bath]
MRIVMTVSNPFNPDPRVYKEAKSLVKAGHEVYVIAWDREGKYPKRETIEGVHVLRLGPRSGYGYRMIFGLPLFYLNALRAVLHLKPDVIHTHDFDTAVLGFLLKLIKRTKWVYDIHDLYFTFFSMETDKEMFLGKIVETLDLLFAKNSTHVIVATQSIGGKHEGLREYYIINSVLPDSITTIWNTPEIVTFSNYLDLGLKWSNKLTIGFIGSIRTISNFIPLFEALSKEPNRYRILFVGGGKNVSKLQELVKTRYAELDIEFVGNVEYRLTPNYYKLCDVVFAWYPPRENVKRAIAVKVFEACSLGVPVIVNGDTLMEDFVREYRCGIPLKELQIDKIINTLNDIPKLKKSLKSFKVMIRDKWNWEREAEKLRRVYVWVTGNTWR